MQRNLLAHGYAWPRNFPYTVEVAIIFPQKGLVVSVTTQPYKQSMADFRELVAGPLRVAL
jgi:hypothetical protein